MEKIIAFSFIFVVAQALTPPHVTGTTPPQVPCSNNLCIGRDDGNFKYTDPNTEVMDPHYFVQCTNEVAFCHACWPLQLVFSPTCNQCLYSENDACITTQKWEPATTFFCPDECPNKGYEFSGNIHDPSNSQQYVACWEGVTVGCVACPSGLEFNEGWNACLYEGKYKTAPTYE